MWVTNAVLDTPAGLDFPRPQRLHFVNGWSVDTTGASHMSRRATCAQASPSSGSSRRSTLRGRAGTNCCSNKYATSARA
jgi:hypothetical protein